jgi:hypothetical protein
MRGVMVGTYKREGDARWTVDVEAVATDMTPCCNLWAQEGRVGARQDHTQDSMLPAHRCQHVKHVGSTEPHSATEIKGSVWTHVTHTNKAM